MKRLMLAVAAVAMLIMTADVAGAAPKPDNPNHPVFPLFCSGGPFPEPPADPFFGYVVVSNGGALGNGVLPTGFVYPPTGDFSGPDLTQDPIVGPSMYRTVEEFEDEDGLIPTGFLVGQARASGNGNNVDTDPAAIAAGIARVTSQWDVAVCATPPLPGALLLLANPGGPYQADKYYVFTNWVK